MSNDLLNDLRIAERLAEGNSPNAARLYREARIEIERCHSRLEIDHHFVMPVSGGEPVRRETPWCDRISMPDGIECRGATIAMLEGGE
ncbi:hypothetical protein [Roseibium album]|uniref:hypothetical protein n=1 Tax=Roseibium album TaxID=311410 RepID=UPI003BAFE6D6